MKFRSERYTEGTKIDKINLWLGKIRPKTELNLFKTCSTCYRV